VIDLLGVVGYYNFLAIVMKRDAYRDAGGGGGAVAAVSGVRQVP